MGRSRAHGPDQLAGLCLDVRGHRHSEPVVHHRTAVAAGSADPLDPVGLHRPGGLPGPVRRQRGPAARHRQYVDRGAERTAGHARTRPYHPLLVHCRTQQRDSRAGRLPAGQPRPVVGRGCRAVRRHLRAVPHRTQRQWPSTLGPQAGATGCRCQRGPPHPRDTAARDTGVHCQHGVAAVPAPGPLRYTRRPAQRAVHRAAGIGPGQFPAQRAVPADPVRHLDLAGHLADDHGPAGGLQLAAGDHRAVLRR